MLVGCGYIDEIYTYETTIKPVFILQKKAVRIITFSKYDEHTSPLFKKLELLKLQDIILMKNNLFIYHFHNNMLPSAFDNFFKPVSTVHSYRTRLASKDSFHLPHARTNYGKFSLRFLGAKIWNETKEEFKSCSQYLFKRNIKNDILMSY